MALISGDWHYLTCIIISADLGRSWKSVNLHLGQSRHLRHLRLKLPCGISSFPNHWFTSHNDKTIPLSHRVGRRLPKQKEKQVNKPSTNIPISRQPTYHPLFLLTHLRNLKIEGAPLNTWVSNGFLFLWDEIFEAQPPTTRRYRSRHQDEGTVDHCTLAG